MLIYFSLDKITTKRACSMDFMKLESFMAGEMVYPVIYVNITQG